MVYDRSIQSEVSTRSEPRGDGDLKKVEKTILRLYREVTA